MVGATSEPSLSAKEAIILRLLIVDGEMYGLQLVDASDGKLARGTVYVTLSRMAEKGFVESRQEPPNPQSIGLPRRMYRSTDHGVAALAVYQRAERNDAAPNATFCSGCERMTIHQHAHVCTVCGYDAEAQAECDDYARAEMDDDHNPLKR